MLQKMRTSVVIGFLIVACAAGLQAAVPKDLAEYTPADTTIYLGWSRWPNESKEQINLARKLVSGMAGEKDRSQALLRTVVADLLLPMIQAPAGISLRNVELEDGEPRVDATLVAAAGPDPGRYPQVMEKLIAEYGEAARLRPLTIKNVALQSYPIGETHIQFIWGVHKDAFIFALSEPAVAALIETMDGAAPNLADSDELKFDRQKVKADLAGAFTCIYGDVPRVLEMVKRIVVAKGGELPPWFNPLIEQTGIASVRSKYLQFEQRDSEAQIRVFAHVTGPVRGLLLLWKQPPLVDDDLRVVPENAYWMYARSLDLAAMWQETMRVVDAVAPQAGPKIEAMEAMSASMLGFSIVNDLLPSFGDKWVLFDSPQQGGFLFTGAVLVAQTRDAAALNAMLLQVVERVNNLVAKEDFGVQQKTIERNGHQIHYVLVAGAPVPVAPAWAFAGQRVIFGLYPQTVATALDQVDAAIAATQPSTPPSTQPSTAVKSILENAEFRAARASLPGPAVGMGYADSRVIARIAYPFLLGLQTALVSRAAPQGAQVDFQTMPPWPEERKRIHTYVSTSSMDADGIMLASNGSGAGGPVIGGVAASGVLASVLLPAVAQARQTSMRVASMSNLRDIGAACHAWADEHGGQFPASLQVLVDDGLIPEQLLHSPRGPTGEVSYVYIAGQSDKSDPRNVLAYERVFDKAGKTNVLFMDGYVEYMRFDEFKKVLADTYKRLGREEEMPSQFRSAGTPLRN
jgi:hypothetical protein